MLSGWTRRGACQPRESAQTLQGHVGAGAGRLRRSRVSGEMRSNVQALRDRGGPSGRRERLWEGGQCFQGAPGWSRSSPWGPQSREGASATLPPPEVPGSPRYQGTAKLRAPNQYSGTETLVRPAAPGQPSSDRDRGFPGLSLSPPGLRGRKGPKAIHPEPRKHQGSCVFLRRHQLTSVP